MSDKIILVGVVLYKNPKEELIKLESSIRAQVAPDCTIKLECWNNCGGDFKWLEELSGKITVHPYQSNLGFGGGHNALMASSGAWTHYLALNPDGMLHQEAIANLLKVDEGFNLMEARQFPHEHPKDYDFESKETKWCSGACLMIPKAVYDTVGGFSDDFFMYCEDVDLSWRVRLNGGKCLFADEALFYHDVEQNDHREDLYLRMLESGVVLARKWGDKVSEKKWLGKLKRRSLGSEGLKNLQEKLANVEVMQLSDIPNFEHDFSFSKTRW